MAKPKILLVEDEADVAFIVSSNLKAEGYDCVTAASGEAGLRLARKNPPALVVSDIMLPGMDGLEMLRLLRKESQVPVVFLSARKDAADRVRGLRLGADDYLGKPFSMRELICRVKVVLQRAERDTPAARLEGPLRVGAIDIDLQRREVRVRGKYRHVTPREFQLLTLLLQADGKVLSRESLLESLWGCDRSMNVTTRTVDQHIARLRRCLLAEKKRIVTVKNVGYKIETGP